MSGRSLLELVQGLLDRTYDARHGLADLAPFVVGDRGFRRHYAATEVRAADGSGARTLVREAGGATRAAIYLPDAMVRRLERHPPQRGLTAQNVQPFAVLVEEVDHLLLLAERARLGRPVTLLELELHANVSKYLVAARFLAGRSPRLAPAQRVWLRHELFERPRYVDPDRATRERYRQAARHAVRLLDGIAPLRPERRLAALRRFHDAGSGDKLRMIDRLAAAA